MKKLLSVFCMLQIMILIYGQSEENATIYFYRQPNYMGSAINMKILLNDVPVVRLKNGSYYKHEVKPAEYLISCIMSGKASLRIKVEPGKVYYIKCYLNPGFWSATPVMELMDRISGESVVEGGMLKKQEYEPVSMIKPRSRIGGYFGGGGGFEKIHMGYTDENDELTLSSGGGFGVGAEYGTEVSKYFDLSFNMFFQSSTLTPHVKNADASFNRIGIIATPALIIPIKGGDFFRFRIGAGAGYYAGSRMKIEGSEAGGVDVKLKYKSSIGFHGSFIFESNFSEKGSFSMGLKYYNINYKYTSEGSTGRSTDPKVNNPDGSGLDFVMGYYYHF